MPADRLPLAFRVGITGTRAIAPAALPRLRGDVSDVLAAVRASCAAVAAEPWAPKVYAPGALRLSLLSPLAVGSDRLAAEAALDQGYALTAVLPFPADDYARDFPDSVEAFHQLLERAGGRVLTLDGARGEAEWRSYEAVGRVVVRNCDLLIAIWDDAVPAKGRGGTEDTLDFALRAGVPVWWIHAAGTRPPRLLTEAHEHLGHTPPGFQADAMDRLRRLIANRLCPPGCAAGSEGTPEPIRTILEQEPASAGSTLPVGWRGYQTLVTLLTGRMPLPAPGPDAWDDHWGWLYRRVDGHAGAFAARYRSTYVYVIVLAALALGFAACALAEEALDAPRLMLIATGLGELTALLVLAALVLWARRAQWHALWLGTRLLAELCRKQQALASLGWSLPRHGVILAAGPGGNEGGWVGWCFDAALRAAPLVSGALVGARLLAAREAVRDRLWTGQTAYHHRRAALSERAAQRLLRFGGLCFGGTLMLVALKLGLLVAHVETPLTVGLGLSAAVLPTVSAAAFAIRAYAEFDVLREQSERMIQWLDALDARLAAFDANRPLASQDLGASVYDVTTAMLADVTGWIQVFRTKAVEAG